MPGQYSSRTADKFVVRLPEGMRERIAEVSNDNHRSMNSEIVSRLEKSLIDDMLENHPSKMIELDPEGSVSISDPVEAWIPQTGMLVCRRSDSSHVFKLTGFMADGDKIVARLDTILGKSIPFLVIKELKPYIAR